jgi:hypothetical protein
MKDQVRRMAENDEPKCGNCKRYAVGERFFPSHGTCIVKLRPDDAVQMTITRPVEDLSLCSAWEPRE